MKLFSSSSKKRRLEVSPTSSGHVVSQQQAAEAEALESFRKNLPTHAFRKELVQAIHHEPNKVVLVVAQTGSGKSTQIPAYLLHNTSHRIAVTQPRRVAAITLATRVSMENGNSVLGRHVGYRVRFDDCTCYDTQLTYVTDGMLLREAMVDPLLKAYSIIFLDEAHERSLQTDILLGVVQRARKARLATRSSLKVVVMSATLETETFEQFFGGADHVTTICIPGRQFSVQTLYSSKPVEDYVEATLSAILQIHWHEEDDGDILAFLPGQEEIEDVAALLRNQLLEEEAAQWTGDKVVSLSDTNLHHGGGGSGGGGSTLLVNNVMICLLYAALPPEAQLAAFAVKPKGCIRKITLATTIAETSVTLPAIRYVVDCGKHKCRRVTTTGMESLSVENISQAQAEQRQGRAGRVQAGLCFRLYTEDAFQSLDKTSLPEIQRVNLAQVVLQLKGMGVSDPSTFDFITRPDQESLIRATKLLYALSALDDKMQLTDHGKKLAKLPLDPVFGHLLIQSSEFSCVSEMLTAVSALSAENLFYRPAGEGGIAAKAAAAHRRFASHEGDLPTYLNVYQAWQNEAVYVTASSGGRKAQKKRLKQQQQQVTSGRALLSHGDWCQRNFVSGRALARAYHVRQQLRSLCERPIAQNGLGMDVNASCGKEREGFLKCVASGLFLQVASRIKAETEVASDNSRGRAGMLTSSRGRYRTKVGNESVSIHPTSTIFGRNPAPACVTYTELITTKKTYIRGVTQIREEWLHDVARNFYPK